MTPATKDSYRPMLINIDEAALALGLRPATIRQWCLQRKITRVKLGSRTLIPVSEIARLIEQNTIPAAAGNLR